MSAFKIFIAVALIVLIVLLIRANHDIRKDPNKLVQARAYKDPSKPFPASMLFFTYHELAGSDNAPVSPYRIFYVIVLSVALFFFHLYFRD